jgi:hypothetical protein
MFTSSFYKTVLILHNVSRKDTMKEPKIIQITATWYGNPNSYLIFGLSEDNKVYRWLTGKWVIAP